MLNMAIDTSQPVTATRTRKVDPEIIAAWEEIAEAYKRLPEGTPPPTGPEAIDAMVELITTVYGDALRKLSET